MDVLRHTGRAELASFLGGSNAEADAGQWGFAPYTEADLEKQIDADADRSTAPPASRRSKTSHNYVEGINAYIAAANAQPDPEAGRVRAARTSRWNRGRRPT